MKFFIFLVILLFPLSAFSATQYRCNGKIQYRPCSQSFSGTKVKSTGTAALLNSQRNAVKASFKYQQESINAQQLYADILSAKYQKYPHKKNYGQWRGVVRGNGDIHLSLLINKQGEPEENRYMGHVKLKDDETSFNFVSSPPESGKWTWKILAVPK